MLPEHTQILIFGERKRCRYYLFRTAESDLIFV